MSKWTGKRTGVAFNKPSEPKFLTEFKKRTGYKDDKVRIQEKFASMPQGTDEDFADNEEDLPQVGKKCSLFSL